MDLDPKDVEKRRGKTDTKVAEVLSDRKALAALKTLIDLGVGPYIAHCCMAHILRETRHRQAKVAKETGPIALFGMNCADHVIEIVETLLLWSAKGVGFAAGVWFVAREVGITIPL